MVFVGAACSSGGGATGGSSGTSGDTGDPADVIQDATSTTGTTGTTGDDTTDTDTTGDETSTDGEPDADDAGTGVPDVVEDTAEPEPDVPVGPISCDSDKDCAEAGMLCDPLSGLCVECLYESDCGANQHCVEHVCLDYVPCKNSLDCVDTPDTPICDPESGECVQCAGTEDCPLNADCTDNLCVSFTPCVTSKDCTDQVCDKDAIKCVDCLSDDDCADSEQCLEQACVEVLECDSDKDCLDFDKLCDKDAGTCVECMDHPDCPGIYHCDATQCVLDVCVPGQSFCDGETVVGCNEIGNGVELLAACTATQTCVQEGQTATCLDWVCTPGPTYCLENATVTCADDGLSVTATEPCGDDFCVAGECKELVCVPSGSFCEESGVSVGLCAADGLSFESAVCDPETYCEPDGDTAACEPWKCEPTTAICDGNTATTCDALGSGPVAEGTDCADKICHQGACKSLLCAPETSYCVEGVVTLCAPDGLSETPGQLCGAGTWCSADPLAGTALCADQVCNPDLPACDGAVATTCNAQGSGYVEGGTDCTLEELSCFGGECKDVPSGAVPDCTDFECTGKSMDAILCGLELCFPGADYVKAVDVKSLSGSKIDEAYAVVEHFGKVTNDLAPWGPPSYVLLASGPATGTQHSKALGGSGIPDPFSKDGYQTYDVHEIQLLLKAPPTAQGFEITHIFMSVEYEEYIGSSFNDKYYMILNAPLTTKGVDKIINATACSDPGKYFDYEEDGQKFCYMAINTAFSEPCTNPTTDISGTGYECGPGNSSSGSSTGWLKTTSNIEPGEEFTLIFHVHDASDGIYDSEVILDNFKWLFEPTTPGTQTLTPTENPDP